MAKKKFQERVKELCKYNVTLFVAFQRVGLVLTL